MGFSTCARFENSYMTQWKNGSVIPGFSSGNMGVSIEY